MNRNRNDIARCAALCAASASARGFAVAARCQPGATSVALLSPTTSSATVSPAREASHEVSALRSTTKPCANEPSGVSTSRTASSAGWPLNVSVRHSSGATVIVTAVGSGSGGGSTTRGRGLGAGFGGDGAGSVVALMLGTGAVGGGVGSVSVVGVGDFTGSVPLRGAVEPGCGSAPSVTGARSRFPEPSRRRPGALRYCW
jgi:hypothetical protein